MECGRVRGLLQEYMEGWLAEGAAAEVEGHLASCDGCARALAQWRELDRALWRLPWAEAPRGFRDAVLARIGAEDPARVPWRERWVPLILAAAAALLLLLSGNLLDRASPSIKAAVERGEAIAGWAGGTVHGVVRDAVDRGLGGDVGSLTASSGLPPGAVTWAGVAGLVVLFALLRPFWLGKRSLDS